MPRKKKKKEINIKSSETKTFFGLILLVLSIAFILTPFINEDAPVFIQISTLLGWPSVVWGIAILGLSINLLTQGKHFNKSVQTFGLILLSIVLNTLLTFWVPIESLENVSTLQRAGGSLGKSIHIAINNITGDVLELIILIVLLVVAFSMITGVQIKQIAEVISQIFSKISFKDLPQKIGSAMDEGKMIINGEELPQNEENSLRTDIPEQLHIEDGSSDFPSNVNTSVTRMPQAQVPIVNNVESSNTDLAPAKPKYINWKYPSIEGLQEPVKSEQPKEVYKNEARVIETVLRSFNIPAKVVGITIGPTVVRYALAIPAGVAVNRVKRQSSDIEVALKVSRGMMRIEAPIPGTSYIGIEIPNKSPNYVYMKEMARKLLSDADKYELPLILGRDITGNPEIRDLVNMPHLLVAGMTRAGKSVGINSILGGLLLTKTPDELKLILVDPKIV